MAIILPDGLPAAFELAATTLPRLGGRPLEIALVNLMPFKPATERQFARLLDVAARDVAITLVAPPGHVSQHTDRRHIDAFYTPWSELSGRRVDGVIVTGAPVEHLAFEDVDYWPWFRELADWAQRQATHGLFICWAGQAALYLRHGIGKKLLPTKAFGVYRQTVFDRGHALMAGLPGEIATPVSRHSESLAADIGRHDIVPIAASPDTGLAMVDDRAFAATCIFNHLEYEARTLHEEYFRGRSANRAARQLLHSRHAGAAARGCVASQCAPHLRELAGSACRRPHGRPGRLKVSPRSRTCSRRRARCGSRPASRGRARSSGAGAQCGCRWSGRTAPNPCCAPGRAACRG